MATVSATPKGGVTANSPPIWCVWDLTALFRHMCNDSIAGRSAKKAAAGPAPVKREGRVCFGIEYFATEADADAKAAIVVARGDTYNGGWSHGSPCGRNWSFDHTDADGRKLFAVTTA